MCFRAAQGSKRLSGQCVMNVHQNNPMVEPSNFKIKRLATQKVACAEKPAHRLL